MVRDQPLDTSDGYGKGVVIGYPRGYIIMVREQPLDILDIIYEQGKGTAIGYLKGYIIMVREQPLDRLEVELLYILGRLEDLFLTFSEKE